MFLYHLLLVFILRLPNFPLLLFKNLYVYFYSLTFSTVTDIFLFIHPFFSFNCFHLLSVSELHIIIFLLRYISFSLTSSTLSLSSLLHISSSLLASSFINSAPDFLLSYLRPAHFFPLPYLFRSLFLSFFTLSHIFFSYRQTLSPFFSFLTQFPCTSLFLLTLTPYQHLSSSCPHTPSLTSNSPVSFITKFCIFTLTLSLAHSSALVIGFPHPSPLIPFHIALLILFTVLPSSLHGFSLSSPILLFY